LADAATTTITEKNPWVTRRTGAEHLRDAELHSTLLAARVTELRNGIARELQRQSRAGADGFDAVLVVQPALIDLAVAAAERDAYDAAARRAASTEDDAVRTVLERLLALFALQTVASHAAWYLEHGYLEPAKMRALRDEVVTLCAELRPDAVALVDAFAIPDNCLGAPIAIGGD
jgi:acyl-CoA oxidase